MHIIRVVVVLLVECKVKYSMDIVENKIYSIQDMTNTSLKLIIRENRSSYTDIINIERSGRK